jgi:hypothetical protein
MVYVGLERSASAAHQRLSGPVKLAVVVSNDHSRKVHCSSLGILDMIGASGEMNRQKAAFFGN